MKTNTYVQIAQNDEIVKQNKKLLEQNDEIIKLLKANSKQRRNVE